VRPVSTVQIVQLPSTFVAQLYPAVYGELLQQNVHVTARSKRAQQVLCVGSKEDVSSRRLFLLLALPDHPLYRLARNLRIVLQISQPNFLLCYHPSVHLAILHGDRQITQQASQAGIQRLYHPFSQRRVLRKSRRNSHLNSQQKSHQGRQLSYQRINHPISQL